MSSLGRQRRVEADHVTRCEQLVEVQPDCLERGRVRRVVAREVGDLHAEGAAAGGDARADPTEADDPEPAAAQVVADHEVEAPRPGTPGPDQPLPLAQPPAGGEDQGEGEVGGRVVEDARRVGDDDPAPRAGGEVDVVEADGDVADAAQLRPGGVEELVVDAVVEHRGDHVGPGDQLQQPLPREPSAPRPTADLTHRAEDLGRPSWQRCGGDDRRHSITWF